MTNTDQKLLFSEEPAINCFILASAYVGSRTMFFGNEPGFDIAGTHIGGATSFGAVMNPAIAIGIQMSSLLS